MWLIIVLIVIAFLVAPMLSEHIHMQRFREEEAEKRQKEEIIRRNLIKRAHDYAKSFSREELLKQNCFKKNKYCISGDKSFYETSFNWEGDFDHEPFWRESPIYSDIERIANNNSVEFYERYDLIDNEITTTILQTLNEPFEFFDAVKKSSDTEKIKNFIKNININMREERPGEFYNMTALDIALSENPNPKIALVLIEAGAGVDDETWKIALKKSSADIINILVQKGFDINKDDDTGQTPLMIAAENNSNPEVISTLIELGAKVNAGDDWNETALMKAAIKNPNPEIVKILIRYGADINAKDDRGENLINKIVKAGKTSMDIFKAIIEAGAKLDNQEWLAILKNNFSLELIDLFLRSGGDVNAHDDNRTTPLLLAVKNKNEEAVKILIEAEADVNFRYSNEQTALIIAVKNSDIKMLKELINAKADLNAHDKNGMTALLISVENSDENTAKILIEAGADINFRYTDNKTILMRVAEKNLSLEFFKYVLEKSLSTLNAQDNKNKNVFDYAAESKNRFISIWGRRKGNYEFPKKE